MIEEIFDLVKVGYVLPANSRLFHLFEYQYGPTSFNDSGMGERRFDPIAYEDGTVIPSYYAALYHVDAFAETIMRKDQLGTRVFYGDKLGEQGLAQVDMRRQAFLLDLNEAPGVSELLKQDNAAYEELQNLALFIAVNDTERKIDGLIWDGYQRGLPGQRCIMFFGDRVNQDDLELRIDEPIVSVTGRQKLMEASRALECDVPTQFLS